MKKLFTICSLLLVAACFSATAQSARLVLAEEFTNASCGPCAVQNPNFNTLLNNNAAKVVAIKYQTDWPGVDPMNAQTATQVDTRVSYYAVNSVPQATMDGVKQSGGSYLGAPANWTQAKLDTRSAITSPFDLTVSHTISADYDSMFIHVTITATGAVSGNLVLHTVMIERNIEFCTAPGTNGETEYEGVMRQMIPSASGNPLAGTWTVGQTQSFDYSVALPSYIYDKNTLAAVAFIQDNNTLDVKQAAYSQPQPMAVDAELACGAVGNPTIACNATWAPNLTIKNNGTTPLTSATINYTIDGVAQTPYVWSGNLASGQTVIIVLPNVNPVVGLRTLSFTISLPNGQNDLNVAQDVFTASYYDYGLVGLALPASENFASATFPPTPAWRVVNPNNGAGWTRSTYGLNGSGSARMYFYGSALNQTDELWMPNYDFSDLAITSAQIDFDLSHAQYVDNGVWSNDRMEVQFSINCGQNWTTIYNESGAALASGNAPDSAASFVPSGPSQWHHKSANLGGAIGQESVMIRFKATSNNGNNCYIDNINVFTNLTASVPKVINESEISLFPNPSSGSFSIRISLNKTEDVKVVITNALGAVVKTMEISDVTSGVYPVDLSSEAKGTYEVSIIANSQTVTKRISITE